LGSTVRRAPRQRLSLAWLKSGRGHLCCAAIFFLDNFVQRT
jgi:hypothetical protein